MVEMRVQIEGKAIAQDIVSVMKGYGLEVGNNPDIVMTIGGDGSTIYGFKKYGRPILPLRLANSSESLGFISDATIDDLGIVCERLRDGKYRIEKYLLLDLYSNDEKIGSAANDIILHQKNPLKAIRFDVYCDGKRLFEASRLVGDGVIIATPFGSTAYNASAGGYLVDYKNNEMVVTLNNVGGADEKNLRSKRISENSVLRLELQRPDDALLGVDGYEKFAMKSSDKIEVRKSKKSFEVMSIDGLEESWHRKIRRRRSWLKSDI